MKTMSLRITEEEHNKINQLAKKEHRSFAATLLYYTLKEAEKIEK